MCDLAPRGRCAGHARVAMQKTANAYENAYPGPRPAVEPLTSATEAMQANSGYAALLARAERQHAADAARLFGGRGVEAPPQRPHLAAQVSERMWRQDVLAGH